MMKSAKGILIDFFMENDEIYLVEVSLFETFREWSGNLIAFWKGLMYLLCVTYTHVNIICDWGVNEGYTSSFIHSEAFNKITKNCLLNTKFQ